MYDNSYATQSTKFVTLSHKDSSLLTGQPLTIEFSRNAHRNEVQVCLMTGKPTRKSPRYTRPMPKATSEEVYVGYAMTGADCCSFVT